MSAINNQYRSGNADPQRVNERALRMRYCLLLKLYFIKLEEGIRHHLKFGIRNSHSCIVVVGSS